MTYHKDTDRILAKPELLALTNKFLSEFFELYGKLNNGKRDDGYAFDYNLIECLVNSDYMINNKEECYGELMGMGFVQNTVNGFFEYNIAKFELHDKIAFILNNFDAQIPYDDWRVTDLNTVKDTTIVEDFDMDVMLGRVEATADRPAIFKVERNRTKQSFTLFNSKSGYTGICEVVEIEEETNKVIKLYTSDKKTLQLSIDVKQSHKFVDMESGKYELYIELEPKIVHYRYCADINGFINVINQVYYGIQDNLK